MDMTLFIAKLINWFSRDRFILVSWNKDGRVRFFGNATNWQIKIVIEDMLEKMKAEEILRQKK